MQRLVHKFIGGINETAEKMGVDTQQIFLPDSRLPKQAS